MYGVAHLLIRRYVYSALLKIKGFNEDVLGK